MKKIDTWQPEKKLFHCPSFMLCSMLMPTQAHLKNLHLWCEMEISDHWVKKCFENLSTKEITDHHKKITGIPTEMAMEFKSCNQIFDIKEGEKNCLTIPSAHSHTHARCSHPHAPVSLHLSTCSNPYINKMVLKWWVTAMDNGERQWPQARVRVT